MNTTHASSLLMGMAIGDALGATVEFQSPESIASSYGELRDIIGGGWLHLEPGQTTDDTQMAVCIIRSLQDAGGYHTTACVQRYLQWMNSGPPDVGATISQVLRAVNNGHTPARATAEQHQYSGGKSAGNGALMRCWPLVVAYEGTEREAALRYDAGSTHYDSLAADACIFAGRVCDALANGETDVQTMFEQAGEGLHEEVYLASQKSRETARATSMNAMGFVLTSLGIGCAALQFDDAEEGLIWAVNCGGDADTNGAIAGAMLGARGVVWPSRWIETIDVGQWLQAASPWLAETEFAAPVDARAQTVPAPAFND